MVEEVDFPELQLIVDQLVPLVASQRYGHLNGSAPIFDKRVIVSARETNDLHVGVDLIYINPIFLTRGCQGNPLDVIQHLFEVSDEFEETRKRTTLHAINDLKHRLRICIQQLKDLDPDALNSIFEEELNSDEVHVKVIS